MDQWWVKPCDFRPPGRLLDSVAYNYPLDISHQNPLTKCPTQRGRTIPENYQRIPSNHPESGTWGIQPWRPES